MPTLAQILATGTTYGLQPKPLYEPISAPGLINDTLIRFGEDYDLSTGSNLYRFLLALCGEAGAGSLRKGMLYPKLQSQLESTHFTDLDRIYGSPIGIPRLPAEIYNFDPRNEALTQDQWDQVYASDASYRARCLIWMRAIIAGPTPEGLALAGEAALGVRCDIAEQYQYVENQASDDPIALTNVGQTNSSREFIIIPEVDTVDQPSRRTAAYLVDQLRPLNTIPTVFAGTPATDVVPITAVASSSDGFYVKRLVTGRSDITWPPLNPAEGIWITSAQQEAPTFAFMNSQESTTFLSVAAVTSSSNEVGPFNSTQQQLFGYLGQTIPSTYIFDPNNSYAQAVSPIQFSIPWTASS